MQCAWDEEWGALGYRRVLGIMFLLTRSTDFLSGGSDIAGDDLEGNMTISRQKSERGRDRDGDRDNHKDRDRDRDRDKKEERRDKEKDRDRDGGRGIDMSQNSRKYDRSDGNDYDNNSNTDYRKNNQYLDFKKELKREKEKAIEFSIQIIFAFHDSISPFLDSLWSVRNLQIKCISNLFNSPNISELKNDMVPIFLNLMCDFDVRNRLAVAR